MLFARRPGHDGGNLRNFDWTVGAALMLAAGTLSSLHLGRTLGASEAYTAMAAGQHGFRAVVDATLRFDPGKSPLYPILLHGVVAAFGNSEVALRAPSVIFAMISVALLLALGIEMFDAHVGVAAAILWALNPLSIYYGSWARMYAMLVTLSLAQLLVLWKLRTRPGTGSIFACAALEAAMLYTHLGSVLFLGAEAMMLARAAGRSERNWTAWTALLLGAIAFVPLVPVESRQVHAFISGHWLDWIGAAHHTSVARKAAAAITAAAILGIFVFGPRVEAEAAEPIRWCAAISVLPMAALAAGSIAMRPMFSIRYVAPSAALLALLIARMLACLEQRSFRLATAGIATSLVCLLPYYPWYDTWRDMARVVARGAAGEPVFFESGYYGSNASEINPDQGFPQGFLRVPFDRYFTGPNPRAVIDPSKPAQARLSIAQAATAANGAWLITGFGDQKAHDELPARCFAVEKNRVESYYAHLYHVVPAANCR